MRTQLFAIFLATGFSLTVFAQDKIPVKGTVLDSDGEPIIGANVLVKGATTGAATDIDGKYIIETNRDAVLEFSCLGFATVTEKVAGRQVVNIVLQPDNTFLETVVVVGYGTQKRGSLTGAVSGVDSGNAAFDAAYASKV